MDRHHEVMLSEQTYIISTQPKNHPTLDTLSLARLLDGCIEFFATCGH